MTKKLQKILTLSLTLATVSLFTAQVSYAEAAKTPVKTVVSSTEAPLSWADENGEIHGYEVEVLREVDKLLKSYTLELEAVPPETQDVLMESGDAKVAAGGYFKNPQREKNFILPPSPSGASNLLVYVVKGNETRFKNLEDVIKARLPLVPLTPNGGAFRIVSEWNEKHGKPLKEIPIQAGLSTAERIAGVISGQYEAYVTPDNLGVVDLAASQGLELVALEEPVKVNPTYLLVNKEEVQLGKEIDAALQQLRENGTLSALNIKWYKDDLLRHLK